MTKADLVAYRQMLIEVRDRIGKLIAAKKTVDEIKAAKPLADLDAKWGQGFVKADFVIEAVVKTHPRPPRRQGHGKKSRTAAHQRIFVRRPRTFPRLVRLRIHEQAGLRARATRSTRSRSAPPARSPGTRCGPRAGTGGCGSAGSVGKTSTTSRR